MNKIASLREALLASNPHLRQRPDSLFTFIESGTIAATMGRGNGWRYHYSLSLLLTDYAGHPDSVFAPLIAWVRDNQPDILLDQSGKQQIGFEVEVLSDATYDIAIKLPLSESVVLTQGTDGKITATHKAEPPALDAVSADAPTVWQVIAGGEDVDA